MTPATHSLYKKVCTHLLLKGILFLALFSASGNTSAAALQQTPAKTELIVSFEKKSKRAISYKRSLALFQKKIFTAQLSRQSFLYTIAWHNIIAQINFSAAGKTYQSIYRPAYYKPMIIPRSAEDPVLHSCTV
jgi:hypothetical protein